MHIELRARAACEMVLNKDYYVQEDIVSISQGGTVISRNTIPASSRNFPEVRCNSCDSTTVAVEVFERDCCDTPNLGSFAGMWHIYALGNSY